jgi:alpha-amylase
MIGGKGFIAMNRGSSTWNANLQSGLPAGSYCNVIANGCSALTVASNGYVSVAVPAQSAVALHVNSKA